MLENLHPGSFYLYSPKHGALPAFLGISFGRDRVAQDRIAALVK
jgi:hypothetical protein